MIDLQLQWCIQIDVTNTCVRRCSNCTRLIGQVVDPFFMPVEQYEQAVLCLADFPSQSPPAADPMFRGLNSKVVGMIGGEPLLHPEFESLAEIVERHIPAREQRGLWTGLRWQETEHADVIRRVFGYVNNNVHEHSFHSPVLAAIGDLIQDEDERKRLIDSCWLQRIWAGTITPRGLFFCEVAGAMDMVFDGPGGLPIEPGCWRRPVEDFQNQIDRWCVRCGIAMNMQGRLDSENIDDITHSNLIHVKRPERCQLVERVTKDPVDPWRYMR